MNRIVGLDVGRGSAVLCCLEEFPTNILQHFKKLRNEKKFYQVNCSRAGVEKLLSLNPTALVLEPSGYWYSHFWVTVAKKHNISIYWVGHADLAGQRAHFGFTNKRDDEDSLCLAACYFDAEFVDIHGKKRFLNLIHNQAITRIRELFHEKEQLQKLRTGLIAQLRQRLSYEFPEAARHKMSISASKGFTPIIYWLANNTQAKRYDTKYAASIAHELEIKITDYTRAHAKTIVDLEQRITKTMKQLENLLALPQFYDYHKVFDRFCFGTTTRALLLYHVFPIDKFLVNGKPWVEYEQSNGKLQKRDRSLRKFQAFLGLAFSYEISGNSKTRKYHGSSLVRAHLYAWSVCLVTRKGNVIGTPIGKELSDRYLELRQNVRGKDSLNRLLFKVTRILFFELVKEIKIG